MNAMEEYHLTIETIQDGKRVGIEQIHDPFLHNRTTIELSIWDWLAMLWRGRVINIEIKIRGDDEAHRQWFRTDPLPKSNGPTVLGRG